MENNEKYLQKPGLNKGKSCAFAPQPGKGVLRRPVCRWRTFAHQTNIFDKNPWMWRAKTEETRTFLPQKPGF
ncbi:MAG: hypothetical protein IJN53_01960 [Oscillospiraceae bacterium]|nr:hypothetical protein [Oscillospiraceae bacterium]